MLRNRISKIKIYIFKIQIINSGPHVKKKPLSQYTDTSTYPRIQYVMRVKNGALHQRASPTAPSIPPFHRKKKDARKRLHRADNAKGARPALSSRALSREKDTSETAKKKRENRTFYIRGHALERFIVTSSQRGAQFRWRVFRSNSFQSVFH